MAVESEQLLRDDVQQAHAGRYQRAPLDRGGLIFIVPRIEELDDELGYLLDEIEEGQLHHILVWVHDVVFDLIDCPRKQNQTLGVRGYQEDEDDVVQVRELLLIELVSRHLQLAQHAIRDHQYRDHREDYAGPKDIKSPFASHVIGKHAVHEEVDRASDADQEAQIRARGF